MVQTKSQKEWYQKKMQDPEWRERKIEEQRIYYYEKMKDPEWRKSRCVLQKKRWDSLDQSTRREYNRNTKKNRNNNKLILINEHGGKCSMCGYDKNYSALDFHHDKGKDSEISNLLFNLDKARDEAKDCILLCVRCHRELHNPECNTK